MNIVTVTLVLLDFTELLEVIVFLLVVISSQEIGLLPSLEVDVLIVGLSLPVGPALLGLDLGIALEVVAAGVGADLAAIDEVAHVVEEAVEIEVSQPRALRKHACKPPA